MAAVKANNDTEPTQERESVTEKATVPVSEIIHAPVPALQVEAPPTGDVRVTEVYGGCVPPEIAAELLLAKQDGEMANTGGLASVTVSVCEVHESVIVSV